MAILASTGCIPVGAMLPGRKLGNISCFSGALERRYPSKLFLVAIASRIWGAPLLELTMFHVPVRIQVTYEIISGLPPSQTVVGEGSS
ncbi:hypothetical protein Nepgr_010553 [Nepenthes gracilis]|uniref:Uncharacterized protein n=1 Tax=Nepenthes gracilis TaxID=150966 RepID=A0AAD3XL55_NEPGR|nr:hypothetical protein Nepgr_010553 [Nepenthes gracilis]